MSIKGVLITSLVVVLFLTFSSWRIERLEKVDQESTNNLVINVK